MSKKMHVNFLNVIITVEAESPEAAYDRLCEVLNRNDGDLEYTTNTFTTHATERYAKETEPRSTYTLWPDNRKGD